MRLFGGDQIARIMTAFKLPEDTPIEHGMVGKAIQNAQVKVETHNFDIRKHLVEYDDVANKQREIIYGLRRDALNAALDKELAKSVSGDLKDKIYREAENLVAMYAPDGVSEKELTKIVQEFSTVIPFDESSLEKLRSDAPKNPEKLKDFLKQVIDQIWESRQKSLGETVARDIEKFVMLSVIDTLWIQHLDTLDDLREGIGLRAAGQRDPLVEYKQEAFNLFDKLVGTIDYEIVHRIVKVQLQQQPTIEKIEEKGIEVHEESSLSNIPNNPNLPNLPNAAAKDPLTMSDAELEAEIARLEKEQGSASIPKDVEFSKNPEEMTDEELNAEIARLEAIEKSPQLGSANPYNSVTQPLKVAKVGRNDPCPCGSGLKWKKCGLINAPEHRK